MCTAKFRALTLPPLRMSNIWNLFMSLWQPPKISSKWIFDLESNTLKYKFGQIQHLIDKCVQEISPKFSWNQSLWKVIKEGHIKRSLTLCSIIISERTILSRKKKKWEIYKIVTLSQTCSHHITPWVKAIMLLHTIEHSKPESSKI